MLTPAVRLVGRACAQHGTAASTRPRFGASVDHGCHGCARCAGLDIVGFYVLCPAAAFAGAAGALAALAAAACKELSAARGLPSLLLLHMDSVTGALALREAGPGQLRPAELRVAGVADQMATLQSR